MDATYLVGAPSGEPPPAGDPTGTSAHGLEHVLSERVLVLKSILGDIGREIGNRRALSRSALRAIEVHYLSIKAKLLEINQWPLSGNRAIEQRRSQLEAMLDTLVAEQRREHVQRWQDIARLKAESRTWLKQYADFAARVRLLLHDDPKDR